MHKKVAVVILNYNGEAMLTRFLPRVVECSPEARVVVADNGSTDASVSLLRRDFPLVEVVELGANYGFAEGYNRVIAMVDSPYLMLLNSDVEVTEGWLAPLIALMEEDENVVACQPKIKAYNNKAYFEYAGAAGGFIDAYGYPFCRGRVFDTVEEDFGQYDNSCRVFWATGAALLVRRSVFEAVGGFDARFFAHMEEIDLCWRILARGGVIMSVPASVVYHIGGATLKKENPQKCYLNFRNNLLMLYKNLPENRLGAVMRMRFLLDCVAALKFLFGGDVASFRAVLRARRDFSRMKKDFLQARNDNLENCVVADIKEQAGFLLLWQYYAKSMHTFKQLLRGK